MGHKNKLEGPHYGHVWCNRLIERIITVIIYANNEGIYLNELPMNLIKEEKDH